MLKPVKRFANIMLWTLTTTIVTAVLLGLVEGITFFALQMGNGDAVAPKSHLLFIVNTAVPLLVGLIFFVAGLRGRLPGTGGKTPPPLPRP